MPSVFGLRGIYIVTLFISKVDKKLNYFKVILYTHIRNFQIIYRHANSLNFYIIHTNKLCNHICQINSDLGFGVFLKRKDNFLKLLI